MGKRIKSEKKGGGGDGIKDHWRIYTPVQNVKGSENLCIILFLLGKVKTASKLIEIMYRIFTLTHPLTYQDLVILQQRKIQVAIFGWLQLADQTDLEESTW